MWYQVVQLLQLHMYAVLQSAPIGVPFTADWIEAPDDEQLKKFLAKFNNYFFNGIRFIFKAVSSLNDI